MDLRHSSTSTPLSPVVRISDGESLHRRGFVLRRNGRSHVLHQRAEKGRSRARSSPPSAWVVASHRTINLESIILYVFTLPKLEFPSLSPSLSSHKARRESPSPYTKMSPSTGSYTPPEETPWTIDELMRKRALEHPDVPLVAYPTAGIEYVEYTASQLDIFAFRIAQNYSKCISRRKSSAEKIKVVAILASSTIDYLLSTLALTKMGFTVLFLSTRLSEQAYLSLLTTTGCCDIVADSAMRKTAVSLLPQLPRLRVHDFITADVYSQALPIDESNTAMDSEYDPAVESANVCWVIHSSGSTGLPKPIYQTHAAALRNYANNFNMKGYITLPLYHAHGISSVFRGIHSLQLIHMYNASLPLTAPTLIDTMKKHAFEVFYGVPYALKLLGESQQGIDVLKKLKLVMFGGSSCPKDLGDRLVKNGVPLISHYGT